jgi:hypothetical protein
MTLSHELEHKMIGPILAQIEKDLAYANKILGIKKNE